MNRFKIISYATQGTSYEEVINNYLLPSIHKYPDMEYKVELIPNFGTWHLNTDYKPKFIGDRLKECENNDVVVFLDADAVIQEYPYLFREIPEEYDIACHLLDHNTWYRNGSGLKELLSGTMWIRNNNKTRALVKNWHEATKTTGEWEQKVLQKVLKEFQEIKLYELPLEYCYIKTLPNGWEPYIKITNPVIVHHQVSRQLKRRIPYEL